MNMQRHWLEQQPHPRKAIVIVEDHSFHLSEMVQRLSEGPYLSQMTLVCLDRPGPDTTAEVTRWLNGAPGLHVAARLTTADLIEVDEMDHCRFIPLPDEVFQSQHRFCKMVASLIRPGGLLIQDIQLETLNFIGEEDWWETIFLASTVRGMLPQAPPGCRFMSNKSGFGISFGRELMEAGFDPRDVIDKNDLRELIGAVLDDYMDLHFPYHLEWVQGDEEPIEERVGSNDWEPLQDALDLVLWLARDTPSLGGSLMRRKVSQSKTVLKPKEAEAATWECLIADRLEAGSGVLIDDVGARLSPPDSLRAERTNVAARHLHTLRGRLKDGEAIVTAKGSYRLRSDLKVGRVTR